MKQVFKAILIISFIGTNAYAQYCNIAYNCKKHINKQTLNPELICTLPAMPTFTITAENVLDGSGKLKRYWNGGKTVCDVLGWMNEAVPFATTHFQGMNKAITTPLELLLSHLESPTLGGETVRDQIHLDTDVKDDHTTENECYDPDYDDNNANHLINCSDVHKDQDGNIHSHRMKYITVHEFWHFLAFNTGQGAGGDWVQEAPARSFEDIVYDGENPYTDRLFIDHLYNNYYIAFYSFHSSSCGMI